MLTASTFTRGLTALTGIPDNFVVQATVILLAAVIFCLSSYIGIDGGMQRLSKMVGWGAFVFAGLVLLVGPTEFTINNTINAIGLTAQNFLQMSLFTDPMGDGASAAAGRCSTGCGGFLTPGVAMFVTRVSRGRKIKEVIWALLLGAPSAAGSSSARWKATPCISSSAGSSTCRRSSTPGAAKPPCRCC